jgi:DNA ligase D-like protein (predicted 3'-phosphoesterase)
MDDRAASALKTYREKRNFDVTPEPAEGGEANESARSFVVQKHWATRLHYDFRLELEGTMKSWAVPKGPSFDPADKRMAVRTEDHPISYNRFEGTIPEKQYGAGKVIVWDKGTWTPLEDPVKGLADGKLKFELHGHKLHGRWTLVRIKGRANDRQEPWLLIKEKDAWVRPASAFSVVDEMPDSVGQLADRPGALPPPGSPPEGTPDAPRNAITAAGDGMSAGSAAPTPADAAPRRRGGAAPKSRSAAAPQGRSAAASKTVEAAPSASGAPAGARPSPLPETLQPELATLVESPPEDPENWIYEIKFDGYRMLTRCEGGHVRLVTRNGNDWTHKLVPLQQALESMELPDGWYDGEIIMPGEQIPADFQALQSAFDGARTAAIVYYLFDIPYCAGHDLREVPLEQRREVLQRVVERKPHDKVRFSAVFDAPPEDVIASACRLGTGGRDRQATPLKLRHAPLCRLGEAQMRPPAGVRHRRLHRSPGLAHRHRLAVAGDPCGRWPSSVRRQRGHRLQRKDPARIAPEARRAGGGQEPVRARGRRHPQEAALGETAAGVRGGLWRVDARRPGPPRGVPRIAHRQAREGDHTRGSHPAHRIGCAGAHRRRRCRQAQEPFAQSRGAARSRRRNGHPARLAASE